MVGQFTTGDHKTVIWIQQKRHHCIVSILYKNTVLPVGILHIPHTGVLLFENISRMDFIKVSKCLRIPKDFFG